MFVSLKPSILDPQGQTIADALHTLGYTAVQKVRQGKYFELDVKANSAKQARELGLEVAEKLLANTVIESYRVELES